MAVLSLAVEESQGRRSALVLDFELVGDPRSQGSKIARVSKGGRPYSQEADDAELKSWRHSLAAACRQAMRERGVERLNYVLLGLEFGFTRPQDHFQRHDGRLSNELKPWAARQIYARGGRDVDKMTRAACDALKDSGLYANDRHVVGFWKGPCRIYASYRYIRVWVWDAEAVEAVRSLV